MKKSFKVHILLLSVLFVSCAEKKKLPTIPPCISERIEKYGNENNPGQPQVFQYNYNGKKVFYIPSFMPDAFSDVLDSACNIICHPDGGITGKGDGKCNDFYQSRKDEKLIWKKEK